MSLSKPSHDDLEFNDSCAVLYTDLDGFSYEETRFTEFWRKDVYGNRYFLSEDEEFVEVEPESIDFKDQVKHVLAYFNNFYNLREEDVNVPSFETGFSLEEPKPYMVMEKPEGTPLSEIPEMLEEDELKNRFDFYNRKGRALAAKNRITYPEKRENRDLFVGSEDLYYVNPGTYMESSFYSQFMNNDMLPDPTGIGMWCSESYWNKKK